MYGTYTSINEYKNMIDLNIKFFILNLNYSSMPIEALYILTEINSSNFISNIYSKGDRDAKKKLKYCVLFGAMSHKTQHSV